MSAMLRVNLTGLQNLITFGESYSSITHECGQPIHDAHGLSDDARATG